MLPLEIIVVLGFLYCLFIYGILRAKRIRERTGEEVKRKGVHLAQEKMVEEKSTPR
jgi:hypothetical protein